MNTFSSDCTIYSENAKGGRLDEKVDSIRSYTSNYNVASDLSMKQRAYPYELYII